jgi:hypothetical protein
MNINKIREKVESELPAHVKIMSSTWTSTSISDYNVILKEASVEAEKWLKNFYKNFLK